MVTIAFSDEIVNATELRNNQKFWLEVASRQPVTIAYGRHNLAILSRERIAKLFRQNHYLWLAVQIYTDISAKRSSTELPWLDYLDDGDKYRFMHEFTDCIKKGMAKEDWRELDALLDDWKATAETLHDSEAMKALTTRGQKKEYVALK